MTDEVCGAETTDGGECQNRAGENGRCWIPSHNDPDAENPHGAPSQLDEYREEILQYAREGLSIKTCAEAAGVDESTMYRWMDRNENFRKSFKRARSEGARLLAVQGLAEDSGKDTSMAKFLLERSHGYTKTEKKELEDVTEGSDGFGTTVVLDSEYVDDE